MSELPKDGGGSAFPNPGFERFDEIAHPGMSLRDWFATHALMSALDTREPLETARRCYEIADAMLEARGK